VSALELIQIVTSSGVLAGGLGILKWALAVERRVMKMEIKMGIAP
jgi:hypothetical protein